MIPILPAVIISKNIIEILFFDLVLRIDTLTNSLSFKQSAFPAPFIPIDYFSITSSDFKKENLKKENLNRPKTRIRYFFLEDYVLGIDKAIKDNRLFFLAWIKKDFKQYRGGAFWKASYFINPYLHKKQWFEFDLSNPKEEWAFCESLSLSEKKKQKNISNFLNGCLWEQNLKKLS